MSPEELSIQRCSVYDHCLMGDNSYKFFLREEKLQEIEWFPHCYRQLPPIGEILLVDETFPHPQEIFHLVLPRMF
jgi:hypothetical protein